ncbi:hypothetical protein, partial [Allosalinactinospora lopnorensis]|uniref:hypothetical protein n=1 Tax=Allosalinactinospora lopnorensis TaxID=1352348 RepID=UPI001F3CE944
MQHQQRGSQGGDPPALQPFGDVGEEPPADREGPPREPYLAFPVVPVASGSASSSSRTRSESAGAPIVTTARTPDTRSAAASTAAPPSEWPIRADGGARVSRRCSAARTRSPTPGGAAGAARPGEAEAEHGDTAAGEAAGDPRGRV